MVLHTKQLQSINSA